jgi:hypothetical protein
VLLKFAQNVPDEVTPVAKQLVILEK